ncbi:cobalt transporter CbiM [Haloimpatiens massiliensis]|uniref:cobalt transporter CbiM n=1 Tax=Haloimpatiens massiliensis TaxID=1658110 RepID=UPI000C814EA5|nr:cobalt transporter CbiM [Haloimpatiens massiliensis]
MHIPDNYLSPSTCAVMGVAMVPVWKRTVTKVKKELSKKKMPLLGVCAAFSFLIMMFNVPAPGGTTAHAVGAALIAIILGPYAACIAVTIALLIQALFFGDGGILAFGANTFNMAFIMPFVAYYVFNSIKSKVKGEKGEYVAVFIAGYISLVIAALCAAIEFGIQPMIFKDAAGAALYCPYALNVAIPAMILPHLIIGLLEGVVTAGVYAYIKKLSPGTIYEGKKENSKSLTGLIIAMIVLSPVGLLASGTAWGEWGTDEIKELAGFVPKGMEKGFEFSSMAPDYSISGLPEIAGYILSAIAGVALIVIIFKIIGVLKKDSNIDMKDKTIES